MNVSELNIHTKGINLLHKGYRVDRNSIRINTHNTLEHELCKVIICYYLIKNKKQVITEAIFKNNKRADIFIPSELKVIEILQTETREQLKKKVSKYPKELKIEYFTTKEILSKEFLNFI